MAFNLIFHHVLHTIYVYVCEKETPADLQVCGVFGDVWRYTGQFEIGAVDHGAFTATFLWTHQILETLPTQTATIVLLTCRGKREGKTKKERKWHRRNRKTGREDRQKSRQQVEREGKKKSQVNEVNRRSRRDKAKGKKTRGREKDKRRHQRDRKFLMLDSVGF